MKEIKLQTYREYLKEDLDNLTSYEKEDFLEDIKNNNEINISTEEEFLDFLENEEYLLNQYIEKSSQDLWKLPTMKEKCIYYQNIPDRRVFENIYEDFINELDNTPKEELLKLCANPELDNVFEELLISASVLTEEDLGYTTKMTIEEYEEKQKLKELNKGVENINFEQMKSHLQEMMSKNYENFMKAMIAIEQEYLIDMYLEENPDINKETVLDKVYEKYMDNDYLSQSINESFSEMINDSIIEHKHDLKQAFEIIENNKPWDEISYKARQNLEILTKACDKYPEYMSEVLETTTIIPNYVTKDIKLTKELFDHIPEQVPPAKVLENNFEKTDPALNNENFVKELMAYDNSRALDVYCLLPEEMKEKYSIAVQAIKYSRKNTSETFLDVVPKESQMYKEYKKIFIGQILESSVLAKNSEDFMRKAIEIDPTFFDQASDNLKSNKNLIDLVNMKEKNILKNDEIFLDEFIKIKSEQTKEKSKLSLSKPSGKGLER